MPFPIMMRKKMLAAVERGESKASVARRFEVSERGLRNFIQRYRERGTLEPNKPGPKQPIKLISADDDTMRALIEADPGITLQRIAEQLSVRVAESTVCRRLQKLNITLKKKSLIAREQQRPDVIERRHNFMIAKRFIDPCKIVVLDESGAKTNMTRLYGRAPIGDRCHFFNAHGHWRTVTMISAMRLTGVVPEATLLIDGPMNAETFHGYIETCLAPTLQPGDVVMMDNLSAHKVAGVEEMIDAVGASVWWLPPYSPDLNPIEKLWSKIKSWLRRAAADTLDRLAIAAGDAFRNVTADECANYFRCCGYGT